MKFRLGTKVTAAKTAKGGVTLTMEPAAGGALPLLVGIGSSAVVSWLAIAWLLRFLQNHSTWWFVGYRVFFGLGVILWAARSVA